MLCVGENTSNHTFTGSIIGFLAVFAGENCRKTKKKTKTKIKCTCYPCCFPSPLQLIINFLLDLSLKTLEIIKKKQCWIKGSFSDTVAVIINCLCVVLFCVFHIPTIHFWWVNVTTDVAEVTLLTELFKIVKKRNPIYFLKNSISF